MNPVLVTLYFIIAFVIAVLYAMFMQWSAKVTGKDLVQPRTGSLIIFWSLIWPFSILMLLAVGALNFIFQKHPAEPGNDKIAEAIKERLGKK